LIVASLVGVLDEAKGAHVMSAEENKVNDRRFFDEGLNRQNLAVADEFLATHIVGHTPTGTTQGLEAYKQYLSLYFSAFPDLQFTVGAQLADGDLTAVQWTATGTQQGALAGIPPTGKSATTAGLTLNRHANGKVVESWVYFDNLSLMQQLGVIPA
jgi:predicted ester cyclase